MVAMISLLLSMAMAIGTEQFVIFAVTVLVTLTTDLLICLVAGVVLGAIGLPTPSRLNRALGLFRNPVGRREFHDGDHTTAETLFHYVADYNSRQLPMELVNWEQLRPLSSHPSAIQLGLSGELIESLPPSVSEQTAVEEATRKTP